MIRTIRYDPWGYTQAAWGSGTAAVKYTYTGKEQDSTGLYYYGARYYNAYLNRWIQPDSIVPGPGNPQDLNRYAYVRNSPLRYTDPSGHCVTPMGVPIPGCFELLTRVAQQAQALLVQYGPQVLQFLYLYGDKLPGLVDQAAQFGRKAGGRIQQALQGGEPGSPGGLNPNDPFRGLPEPVQRGVQTLQRLASNPSVPERFRLGYQAQLERAEYWAGRGGLTGVEVTGEGGVRFDLELGQSTIVEVKYWTAKYAMDPGNLASLAKQLGTYQAQGKQIILKMFQTATNPLTEENWRYILQYLQRESINLSSQSQLLPPMH